MIKAIIVDCFGVLVGRGFAETYRIAGGDPLKDAIFIDDMLTQANRGMISSAEFHQGMADKLGITVEAYDVAVRQAEQPNEELLAYVRELHKTYKTAILSNANVGTLERKLDKAVLSDDFDALIVSAEVDYMKPELEIYRIAAQQLGVEPEECVFTDDQPRYVEAAVEIGMQAIVYNTFDQLKSDLQQILAK